MGVKPLIDSWLKQVAANIIGRKKIAKILPELFQGMIEKGLEFLHHQCKEIVPSMDNNLVQSCCRLLDCFLESFTDTEFKKISEDEMKVLEGGIRPIFFFCYIWSICATVDQDSRKKFDIFVKNLMHDFELED